METNDQPEWAPAEQPSWNPAEWASPVAPPDGNPPSDYSVVHNADASAASEPFIDTHGEQPFSAPAAWTPPAEEYVPWNPSASTNSSTEGLASASEWEIPAPPIPANPWASPTAVTPQEWAPAADATPVWTPPTNSAVEWEPEMPTPNGPEIAMPDGPEFAHRGGEATWEPSVVSGTFEPPVSANPSFSAPNPSFSAPNPSFSAPDSAVYPEPNIAGPAATSDAVFASAADAFRPTPPPWEQAAPAEQSGDWTPPWGSPNAPAAPQGVAADLGTPDASIPSFAAASGLPGRTQLGGPDGTGPKLSPLPSEASDGKITFGGPPEGGPITFDNAPGKSRKKGCLIAVAVAVLVSILAGLGLFFVVKKAVSGPRKQAEAFVDAVIKADVPTAYGLASSSLQSSTSQEKFSEFVKAREASLRGASYSVKSTNVSADSSTGKTATVGMTITSPSGDLEYPSTVTLVSEGGKWLVSGFQIDDPKAGGSTATTLPSAQATVPLESVAPPVEGQSGDTAATDNTIDPAAIDPAVTDPASSVPANPETSGTENTTSDGPVETIPINSGF